MTKANASLIILLGGTCMSFNGLLIRLIQTADGFQILAYRSITLSIIVAIVACLSRKTNLPTFLNSLDRNDLCMGFALSIAFSFYVLAMLNTSVASALMILTVTPFFTALLALFFLGEIPARLTWACMFAAILGVGLMVSEGIDLGRTQGNIYALLSAVAFAVGLIFARKTKHPDPLGGTFMAGLFTILIGLICAGTIGIGFKVSAYDLFLILFMGTFAIGLGIALVTWGTAFVLAAEASLLLLIESLLGPVWVWVFLSEAMSWVEIIGGGLVLTSVVALAVSQKGTPENS